MGVFLSPRNADLFLYSVKFLGFLIAYFSHFVGFGFLQVGNIEPGSFSYRDHILVGAQGGFFFFFRCQFHGLQPYRVGGHFFNFFVYGRHIFKLLHLKLGDFLPFTLQDVLA